MPNEKINDQVSQGWYAEVSWRRKPGVDPDDQGTSPGHVQLATVNVHSPFEFPEVEHGTSWEAGEKFDGWRVTLDEAGIDRLIKALHKAKNQAFGESMAAKADRAVKTWRKDLHDDVGAAAARAKVWSTFGYSDEEIQHLEAALRSGVGPVPSFDPAAPTLPAPAREALLRSGYSTAQLDHVDDLTSRHADVVLHRDELGMLSIRIGGLPLKPEGHVSVESDATAAARLDVEGYRATRRGDR